MIISLIIVAVLIITTVIIYNGIISRENSVKRAWADVITQERQKNKILPELEKIAQHYLQEETDLQTRITALRASLAKLNSDNPDARQLENVERDTHQLLSGLQVSVEAYPELKGSELFNNMMREVTEQQENVGAAIRLFNQNVEEFNNGIQMFPNNIVNATITHKSSVTPFQDSIAQQGFEYRPDI